MDLLIDLVSLTCHGLSINQSMYNFIHKQVNLTASRIIMEWAKLKPKFQQKYCNDNGLGQAMNDTDLNVKHGGIFANFSQRACRCKTRNKTFSYKLWARTVLVCEMDGGGKSFHLILLKA